LARIDGLIRTASSEDNPGAHTQHNWKLSPQFDTNAGTVTGPPVEPARQEDHAELTFRALEQERQAAGDERTDARSAAVL